MNDQIPVELPEKILYLKQKIDNINRQVKRSLDEDYKFRFIQFIDASIESLYFIKDQKLQSQNKLLNRKQNLKNEEKEFNSYKVQKMLMEKKVQKLQQKQRRLVIGQLQLKIENLQIQIDRLKKQGFQKQQKFRQQQRWINQKLENSQKQLERLGKINSHQENQIILLKKQRDRSEKQQYEIRQKYQNLKEAKKIQQEKKIMNKFNTADLQCKKVYTNCNKGLKSQQFVSHSLPLIFQIKKNIYGIKLGIQGSGSEIQYLNQVSLFEGQQVKLCNNSGYLNVEYIKRKKIINIDRISLKKHQITFLLFGKGDSIAIYQ